MSSTRTVWLRIAVLLFVIAIWLSPVPDGLTAQAWHLFAIFIGAIFAVIINAMSVLVAAILALVATILTGTLPAEDAYAGLGSGFLWLIVVAFMVSRAVISSGLGNRIAYSFVRFFGRSTLGLGYCMVFTDALIAPAFPSNTARSGVLYPIVRSLAESLGSRVEDGTRRKLGAYLMMNSMAGLSLSSALWLTAMAANPTGAAMVEPMGVEITFLSWTIAASVPCLVGLVAIPWLLYRWFPPEVKDTPHAPQDAAAKLQEMGPLSRNEWITMLTFAGMVICWAAGGAWGLDKTAIAFLGLGILMLSNIFTLEDLKHSGDALGTLIWFGILYTLSTSLNSLGFMSFVGNELGQLISGLSWPVVYVLLIVLYVLIHYLFVSQTAQLLALFGVFMGVAVKSDVPPTLCALMLLFTTNFFSVITPQASSANVIFAGSGYLTSREIYRNGALVTLVNLLIFLAIGTPWILLVA